MLIIVKFWGKEYSSVVLYLHNTRSYEMKKAWNIPGLLCDKQF